MRKSKLIAPIFAGLLSIAPMYNSAMADPIPETRLESPADCEQVFAKTDWRYILDIGGKKVCANLDKWNTESGRPELFDYTVGRTKVRVNYRNNTFKIGRMLKDGKMRAIKQDPVILNRTISFSNRVSGEIPVFSVYEQFRTSDKEMRESRKDLSTK